MTYIEKSIAGTVLMTAASAFAGQPVEVFDVPQYDSSAVLERGISCPAGEPGDPGVRTVSEPAVLIYIDDDYGHKIPVTYSQYLDYLKYKDSEHPYSEWLTHAFGNAIALTDGVPVPVSSQQATIPIRIQAATGSDAIATLDPKAALAISEQQGWPTWKTALVVGGCVVLTAGLIYAIVEAVDHGGGHNSSSDRNPNVVIDGDNNNVTVRDGSDNNQTTSNDYGYGY